MNYIKNYKYNYQDLSNAIKILAADSIEKAKSGHPGMVFGMADVFTQLVFNHLKFNPNDPKWFNRDRLVLSAGHGSMLLYAFYYLADYKDFTLEDIKSFRQAYSKTPGHPEYGIYDAIETTTGPLGQGFANAVGMAIAQKKYTQKLGGQICNYNIYCIAGDGCLMEGISYEASSLAGHLSLDNLIVLFDSNHISIDGSTNLTISENQELKFRGLGWDVYTVNGHNFSEIDLALQQAKHSTKPAIIICDTIIAKSVVSKEGSCSAHGSPLGEDTIATFKDSIGFKKESFFIPKNIKKIWSDSWRRNEDHYNNWQELVSLQFKQEQSQYMNDVMINDDILSELTKSALVKLEKITSINKEISTRALSGKIIEQLLLQKNISDKMIFGSADLSLSNNIKSNLHDVLNKDNFSGNYIYYGIRENAMCAIMNGLAVSGFIPVGGTFLNFSDYMRPGIRLAALMKLRVIYIMTHDSIGVGEDGPTHQPVEQIASLRAIPNLLVMRPANSYEVLECWKIALSNDKGPSMLVLSRQNLPALFPAKHYLADIFNDIARMGAYIFTIQGMHHTKQGQCDIVIFASGSELAIACRVAESMACNYCVSVISLPCFELFSNQSKDYLLSFLKQPRMKVGIEAASSFGWCRIVGDGGLFFGIDSFGISAPNQEVYKHFGMTCESISAKILSHMKDKDLID
ncbi:MAG: transketolase [Rickettsiaceae bacterium]